jgi:hypothetical protein
VSRRSVTVAAERLPRWLDGFTERHGESAVTATEDEVALVGADGAQAWITVPFPPLSAASDPRAALAAHVLTPRTIGVLLVRRGGAAIGVFEGSTLVASKVDTVYVQGTTRAGGWSQKRFARRRENQSRAAFAQAADIAARVLLPYAARLDALVGGGDRAAIDEVLADPRLAALVQLRREPFLPVPDPRLRVLQAAPEQFRAVRIALDP